jgi:hypothetical protein
VLQAALQQQLLKPTRRVPPSTTMFPPASIMNHPYYPTEAVIANYVPNSSPTLLIVSAFGAMAGVAVVAAYRLTSANARFIDRFAASWFALCEWASFSSSSP